MNDTQKRNISYIFTITNSITFLAGIYFLIQNRLSSCAAALLFTALNFIAYQIYICYVHEQLQKNISREKALSSRLSDNMTEEFQTLTKTCSTLQEQNQTLKNQLSDLECKLQDAPLFYHCPLTAASPINLNRFFSNYFAERAGIFQKTHIKASIQADNTTCETLLSSSALTLICNNLLDNSLKFTPAGGTLLVTLTQNKNDTLIIWKNSGEGISESDISKVFDLNYGNSPAGKGTGLGLTQVKSIVIDYGGCIWVKSTKGTGFAVYLQLPCKPKGELTL